MILSDNVFFNRLHFPSQLHNVHSSIVHWDPIKDTFLKPDAICMLPSNSSQKYCRLLRMKFLWISVFISVKQTNSFKRWQRNSKKKMLLVAEILLFKQLNALVNSFIAVDVVFVNLSNTLCYLYSRLGNNTYFLLFHVVLI